METSPPTDRRRLQESPASVLSLLPALGRLMAIGKQKGVTHERIGRVESVDFADGFAKLGGAAHASGIELARIASITAEFTATMGGKDMPRLEFEDRAGELILKIVVLDGRQEFDRAFGGMPAETAAPAETAPRIEGREVPDDDAGFLALDAVRQSGRSVELLFDRPGFTQAFRGPIEKVSKGMGFSNVMTDTFHLHLRGGTVSGWRWEEGTGRLVALDDLQEPTGLVIIGADPALAGLAAQESAV